MKFNFLFKTLIIGISIVLFASCDRDFNELGAGILGDEHYGMDVTSYNVNAYNQSLGPVQTNNLPVNQFGYYNNPVFGKTKASFVSQLGLAVANPTFYDQPNIVVDSVYLYVPYFSTFVSTDENSNSTYKLDSIYGAQNKIKLGVYESTSVLENLDASTGFQQLQRYYSDKQIDYNTSYGSNGGRLNNDNKSVYDHTITNDKSQNDEFVFDNRQIKTFKKNADGTPGFTDVNERKPPGMLLNLDTDFFKTKIINAPSGSLYNNNVFQNYFRGLYFKVDASSVSTNQGALSMMNFSKGVITIVYKDKTSATDATVIRKTINLNLSGNSVNLLENENTFPGYTTPNPIAGDPNLYLKGGDGSMAIIDLFDGQKNADNVTLNTMRANNWLINEANITFHVNTSLLGTTAPEPKRIYLYDLNNKRPLVDYFIDATTRSSSKYNKFVHDGLLRKSDGSIVVQSSDERGTTYKIKITNHLRNLVKYKDSTNVRLGLVVTEGITQISNFYLKTPFTTSVSGANPYTIQTKFMPVASFINPLGTILFGSNASVPDDKRIKLQIYYTKPD